MDHPIRRPVVQQDIEDFTTHTLARNGGTGKIIIEIDFHEWRAVGYRLSAEGRRIALDKAV